LLAYLTKKNLNSEKLRGGVPKKGSATNCGGVFGEKRVTTPTPKTVLRFACRIEVGFSKWGGKTWGTEKTKSLPTQPQGGRLPLKPLLRGGA